MTWNTLCGAPATATDLNGQVTTHTYDALCRETETQMPGGNFALISYLNLGDPNTQYIEVETPPADGSGNIWKRSYLDGRGREYRSLAKGPAAGQDIAVDMAYAKRGTLASQTQPYYAGGTAQTTSFTADALDRPTLTEHPDSNTVSQHYGLGSAFTSVTTTDEIGHSVTLHHDAYGRVVRKESALGVGTVVELYSYDLLGRLVGIADDAGNDWVYSYDSLGRRLTADDPDLGLWHYSYDDAGQLTQQLDAKGQSSSFTYDALGRVLTKTVWTNTAGGPVSTLTTYAYDEERTGFHNIGQQTTAENPVGRLTFDYDVAGRLAQKTYRLDSVDYVFTTAYDAGGRVLWQGFPDGDTVGTALNPIEYDGAGRTEVIPGVIDAAVYDARGWATSVTRANGVVTSYGYSAARGWLTSVDTLSGATTVQDFDYTRRADGQITAIGSSIAEESWSYGYDDLKRLVSATNSDNAAYSQTFAYDTVGNITYKSDVGSYGYPTPGSARPHAATSAGALGSSYTYDDNGNMTAGGGRTLAWDGEDRPVDINGTTFAYGPDGVRWKKTALGGAVTVTLGEIEIQDYGGVGEKTVKYLPGSARREGSGAGTPQPVTLLEADFESGAEGFVYQDDVFGTSRPVYASGSAKNVGGAEGGVLSVKVGGIDENNIANGMSGGWEETFTLDEAMPVTLSFRYDNIHLGKYDADEFTEVRVLLDGVPVGTGGNVYVSHLDGSVWGVSTGWQSVELELGTLAAGQHTLTIGGYNNKKTKTSEKGEILIDDVAVTGTAAGGGGGGSVTVWLHKDHLGSIQAATDETGAAALRRGYASYGAQLWATAATFTEAKNFIGERLDEETGLLYLNARYYDPVMGQFLSADSSDPLQPGVGVNRYAYAGGNPVAYADPYGLSYGSDRPGGPVDFGDHPVNAASKAAQGRYDREHEGVLGTVDRFIQNLFGNKRVAELKRGALDAIALDVDATAAFLERNPEAIDIVAVAVGAGIDVALGGPTGEGVLIAGGVKAGLTAAKFSLRELANALAKRGASKLSGQLHHGISRSVHKALQRHPNLTGLYKARDPRFVTRARDLKAHNGYDKAHRNLDKEVVDWLDRNPSATRQQFENYMRDLYQRPDVKARFPNGL